MGSLWKNLRFWMFIATIASTSYAGLIIARHSDPNASLGVFSGLPYAISIMFILGCHELGHYLTAKWWGFKKVTLPLFIPMPGSILGTMGALISIKEPVPNRKALFDIAVAGPWAGLAATGFLYFLDLPLSPIYNLQVDFAITIGVVITFLNLFPFGVLDGGRVFYAVFARTDRKLKLGILLLAALYAVFFQRIINVLSLAIMLMMVVALGGMKHEPTQDDDMPLDRPRKVIAAITILAFLVMGVAGKPIKW